MLSPKTISTINKFVPAAIILLCLAVLSRFFTEPFRFTIQADDLIFLENIRDRSVWDSSLAILKRSNGRWFSHFYTCLVFSVLKTKWSIYFIYDILMFLIFTFSLFTFFSAFMKRGFISPLSVSKKILLSFFTASVFFIFLVDGRYEVFYWISSISNHLLSVIFFFFSVTLLVAKPNALRASLLFVFSFCLGQMNEIYVLSYVLVFAFLAMSLRENKFIYLLTLLFLAVGIVINVSSAGAAVRINEAAPDFNLMQTLKDIGNTFMEPVTNYRYLPLKITALALFMFSLRHYFGIRFSLPGNFFLTLNRLLLITTVFGVFAQCYLLRMVCPYRGLLVYSLTLIYFLFVMAERKTLNPLKLFFK